MPPRQSRFAIKMGVRPRVILACSSVPWLLAGCWGGVEGPPRYAISGKVDFAGTPIPYGEIVFQPDSDKGNTGPGAIGKIDKGLYKIPAASGPIGGPHIVRITGLDGMPSAGAAPAAGPAPTANAPTGRPLFKEFQTTAELPKKTMTQDFSVPQGGKH